MDKNQMIREILWLYDERQRLIHQVDRLTTERGAAYTRLMKVTGADRICVTPDGEELLVDRMLRFARRELSRECLYTQAVKVDEDGTAESYDAWAERSVSDYGIPRELSREDVMTILENDMRKAYEKALEVAGTEQEEDDDE